MVKRKYHSQKNMKHSKKRKKSSQKRTKRSKKMIKRSNRRSVGRLNRRRNGKRANKQKTGGSRGQRLHSHAEWRQMVEDNPEEQVEDNPEEQVEDNPEEQVEDNPEEQVEEAVENVEEEEERRYALRNNKDLEEYIEENLEKLKGLRKELRETEGLLRSFKDSLTFTMGDDFDVHENPTGGAFFLYFTRDGWRGNRLITKVKQLIGEIVELETEMNTEAILDILVNHVIETRCLGCPLPPFDPDRKHPRARGPGRDMTDIDYFKKMVDFIIKRFEYFIWNLHLPRYEKELEENKGTLYSVEVELEKLIYNIIYKHQKQLFKKRVLEDKKKKLNPHETKKLNIINDELKEPKLVKAAKADAEWSKVMEAKIRADVAASSDSEEMKTRQLKTLQEKLTRRDPMEPIVIRLALARGSAAVAGGDVLKQLKKTHEELKEREVELEYLKEPPDQRLPQKKQDEMKNEAKKKSDAWVEEQVRIKDEIVTYKLATKKYENIEDHFLGKLPIFDEEVKEKKNRRSEYKQKLSELRNKREEYIKKIEDYKRLIEELKTGDFQYDDGTREGADRDVRALSWLVDHMKDPKETVYQRAWGSLESLESKIKEIEKKIQSKEDLEKNIEEIKKELQRLGAVQVGNRMGRKIFIKNTRKLVADKMLAENNLENITKYLTENTKWDLAIDQYGEAGRWLWREWQKRLPLSSKEEQLNILQRALEGRKNLINFLQNKINEWSKELETIKAEIDTVERAANAVIGHPPIAIDMNNEEQERITAEEAEEQRMAAEEAEEQRMAAEKAEEERMAAEKAKQEEIIAKKTELEKQIKAKQREKVSLKANLNGYKCVEGAEKKRCVKTDPELVRKGEEKAEYINKVACELDCGGSSSDKERYTPFTLRSKAEQEKEDAKIAERYGNAGINDNIIDSLEEEIASDDVLKQKLADLKEMQINRRRDENIKFKEEMSEWKKKAKDRDIAAKIAEQKRIATIEAERKKIVTAIEETNREHERIAAQEAEQDRIEAEKAEQKRIAAEEADNQRLDDLKRYEEMQKEQERRRIEAENSLMISMMNDQDDEEAENQKIIDEENEKIRKEQMEMAKKAEERRKAREAVWAGDTSGVSNKIELWNPPPRENEKLNRLDMLSMPKKKFRRDPPSNGGGKNKLKRKSQKRNSRKKKKSTKPRKSTKKKQSTKPRKSIKKKQSTKSRKRNPSKSTKKKLQKRKSYK